MKNKFSHYKFVLALKFAGILQHEPVKKVYVEMVKEVIESEVDADDAE